MCSRLSYRICLVTCRLKLATFHDFPNDNLSQHWDIYPKNQDHMDLPFTNIRQVLSLHNKVSPEKIFLTVITDSGREELSYGEFSARSHQTANFLQEDLGIQPGDVVSIHDYNLSDVAILLMACWLVGAVAAPYVPLGITEQEEQEGRVKAYFVRDSNGNFNQYIEHPAYKGKPLVQLGGTPTDSYPHFDTLVRSMPNSFFNDHPEPTLDTLALVGPHSIADDRQSYVSMKATQGELLTAAYKFTNQQFITGNQRLISYLKLSGIPFYPGYVLSAMSIYIGTLLMGSSAILCLPWAENPRPGFWRLIASERLHIACVDSLVLSQLIISAKERKTLGKPIYGEGIYQQDIKQLRHIYCPDADSIDIQQFTAIFPFPVVTDVPK